MLLSLYAAAKSAGVQPSAVLRAIISDQLSAREQRDRLLIDLKQVDRQSERVEAHIARQRKIIAELIEHHQSRRALEAQALLKRFKSLRDQHLDHRKRLLTELGDNDGRTLDHGSAVRDVDQRGDQGHRLDAEAHPAVVAQAGSTGAEESGERVKGRAQRA